MLFVVYKQNFKVVFKIVVDLSGMMNGFQNVIVVEKQIGEPVHVSVMDF